VEKPVGLPALVQQAEFSHGPWPINYWATGPLPTSIRALVIKAGEGRTVRTRKEKSTETGKKNGKRAARRAGRDSATRPQEEED